MRDGRHACRTVLDDGSLRWCSQPLHNASRRRERASVAVARLSHQGGEVRSSAVIATALFASGIVQAATIY
jgi:hypothetical protein